MYVLYVLRGQFELISGMDLLDFINSQPDGYIREDDARHYIRQLLSGVCAIHRHGLCHRTLHIKLNLPC